MGEMITLMTREILDRTHERYGTDDMGGAWLVSTRKSSKCKSTRSDKIDRSSSTDARSEGPQKILGRTIRPDPSERIAFMPRRHDKIRTYHAHVDEAVGE